MNDIIAIVVIVGIMILGSYISYSLKWKPLFKSLEEHMKEYIKMKGKENGRG